jgi:hypothetical protein
MDDERSSTCFPHCWAILNDIQYLVDKRPLLAHYTSIGVLEQILKNDELWLSNPLFMNDLQEVRFGMNEGLRLVLQHSLINQTFKPNAKAKVVRDYFSYFYSGFDIKHAFDTYVFCLTEHDPKNTDGMLSMWRGYGGQGNGAALIFNTKLIASENRQSPLIISKVHYGSEAKRKQWLLGKLSAWCKIAKTNNLVAQPDPKIGLTVYQLFNLVKFFALVWKHDGFLEEREWRVIYMPDRDTGNILKSGYHYIIGKNGVEPKLKLKIAPLPGTDNTWVFNDIFERIILGPTVSSPLAIASINRMLVNIGKKDFQPKVTPSTIPLRPAG